MCYTNHALDQFLEDLLDIGIPSNEMVRLGGKSTARTKCMSLHEQSSTFRQTHASCKIIEQLRKKTNVLGTRLTTAFGRYRSASIHFAQLLEYLEFSPEAADFYEAFTVPKAEDGSTRIGRRGKAVNNLYLLERWCNGGNAGIFFDHVRPASKRIWQMPDPARQDSLRKWHHNIMKEQVSELTIIAEQYNDYQGKIERMFKKKDAEIIGSRRIIACTTTAAAKYAEELQAASRDVLLVEEAGEILESHILTSLGMQTQQLVLIGDHKQLRPKVGSYKLTVEKGEGYDLNRSLFERLILKGFPHQTLNQQHRMRPEIACLIRSLTYPDLVDARKTQGRPHIRGLQDNVVFISHERREDEAKESANWKDMTSFSSKQNRFEVDMVLKCVRYLAQQGYGTENIVVITPYLGQLHLLKNVLSRDNDPILNDLDSFDLVRAGLLPAASAKLNQNKIHLSTIDNYQGEESDIVIVSMTRSNEHGDIGFMSAPERLNVLLSRARDGLIMIGNAATFQEARKGKELWSRLFGLLRDGSHVYDGLPVKCERHPKRTAILRETVDFEIECPDGGCKEPCGSILNCGLHSCPQKCHQLYDHSKVHCEYILHDICSKGHKKSWPCHKTPSQSCVKCDQDAQKLQNEMQKALKLQEKRDREERDHAVHMAKLDSMLDEERQRMRDVQRSQEREAAVRQKEKDIAKAKALASQQASQSPQLLVQCAKKRAVESDCQTNSAKSVDVESGEHHPESTEPETQNGHVRRESPAKQEWERQKVMENASNDAIDSIMNMIGLEEVKLQILKIKAKIDVSVRQNSSMKDDRLNVSFLGNPGTGGQNV